MALVSRAEAAQALGVVPARLNKWVDDGAPVVKSGVRGQPARYDVAAIREWLEAKEVVRNESPSLEQARARLTMAQIEKVERENRVRAGELVEADEVIRAGQAYSRAIAGKIRALPSRLVQLGAISREQEAAVVAVCRELLKDAADWRKLEDLERAASSAA